MHMDTCIAAEICDVLMVSDIVMRRSLAEGLRCLPIVTVVNMAMLMVNVVKGPAMFGLSEVGAIGIH